MISGNHFSHYWAWPCVKNSAAVPHWKRCR